MNYHDHCTEQNFPIPTEPVLFSKFASSIIADGEPIPLEEHETAELDFEVELAIVIGRKGRRIPRESALEYIAGWTIAHDVSARDFQFADGQWQRGKACDTFAPFGEFVATTDEIPDPHKLGIRLRLNGETLQDSNTDQLVFGIPELIEDLSTWFTLEPGDVIATGTPPGIGFARKPPVYLKAGDVCEVEIDGLGVLRNPVAAFEA